MKPKVNEFIQALKDHADILSKYLEEHPEALDKILSQLPTHQEPKKDFRQAVMEVLEQVVYCKSTMTTPDQATDRILALCKEMLVPEEAHSGIPVSGICAWESCRQHLLKQLGEK